MKRGNYLSYEFFEMVDRNSELAKFFNKVFKSLHLARLMSAPTIFNESESLKGKRKKNYDQHKYEMFYQTCLFELYAHSVIRKLENWQKTISEYLMEYSGSWEYYARAKRLYSINEYGGSESDYNEDGTVKTDVDSECLQPYCIAYDLVQDDCKDIVLQTKSEHLQSICTSIRVEGSFSLRDMFKAMGAGELKSYRSENGQMAENSEDDELLHKLSSQAKSEDLSIMLMSVVYIIHRIVDQIRNLPKDNDNKEFLQSLTIRIQNIIDMDICDELVSAHKELKNKEDQTE